MIIKQIQKLYFQVYDHLVPHITSAVFHKIDDWDLTTQKILPYINGISHVALIATKANVHKALVKSCIQNLVYYGVVGLLPLLKYSNIYNCTHNLQKLSKQPNFAQSCQYQVAVDTSQTLPKLNKILQIYSAMTHGVALKTLCQRFNPRELNIDERKLIIFGLQHKLIRNINKFPIYTGKEATGRQTYYTGVMHVDEICCTMKISPQTIEEDIETDPNITVIWR